MEKKYTIKEFEEMFDKARTEVIKEMGEEFEKAQSQLGDKNSSLGAAAFHLQNIMVITELKMKLFPKGDLKNEEI